MKWLLPVLALVLVTAVSASAASIVKPLMLYTHNDSDIITTGFATGQTINVRTTYEVKGIGDFKVRLDLLNNRGVVLDRVVEGTHMEDETSFQLWWANPSFAAPATPGYYTLKVVYTDLDTKRSWSHRTKVHVSPPPP